MTSRVCTVCHRPTRGQARRCAIHAYKRDKRYAVTTHNAQMVRNWVDACGLVCIGLGDRRPHKVASIDDLTVHHVVPLARGGPDDGIRIVVCRSCNSAQGAR